MKLRPTAFPTAACLPRCGGMLLLIALLLAMVSIQGCQYEEPKDQPQWVGEATPTPRPSPSQSPTPAKPASVVPEAAAAFRIASVQNLGAVPAILAKQKNWFADFELKASYLDPVKDSKAALDLLDSGKAEVAFGVSLAALLSSEKADESYAIIGFGAETEKAPLTAFVVSADSKIQAIGDVLGKKAVASGTEYASRAAEIYLTDGSGESLPIPTVAIAPDTPFAFQASGGPEVLFVTETAMAIMTRTGSRDSQIRTVARAPLSEKFISPFPVYAVVIRRDTLDKWPHASLAFANATTALLDCTNTQFAQTLPVIQEQFQLDDESTLNLFPPVFLSSGEINRQTLAATQELWIGPPPDDKTTAILPGMIYPVPAP